MSRRQKEIASLILTFLIGLLTNIATSSLPTSWQPYLWLSWVPLGICVIVIVALQFVPNRGDSAEPPAAGSTTNRTVHTGGGDYAEGNIDKRSGVFINGGTVNGPVIGENHGQVTTNYGNAKSPSPSTPNANEPQREGLQRRLKHLEVQQARQGYNTDPAILMEIEDIRRQLGLQ